MLSCCHDGEFDPRARARPAGAGRIRRGRAGRRAGRHRGGRFGRGARPQDADGRALRLPRRHGHRRRRHQFLRAARQRPWRASPGGAWHRRRTAGAHRPARRPEQAACGVRQDPGAGLRHRGLQMRRRRSPARPRRRNPVPRARRRRGDGHGRHHPRADRGDEVRPRRGDRPHLHRLLGRRRSRGLGRRAVRARRRPRRHALSDHDVSPERRRSGRRRRSLDHASRR